jgi:hypothetical protein
MVARKDEMQARCSEAVIWRLMIDWRTCLLSCKQRKTCTLYTESNARRTSYEWNILRLQYYSGGWGALPRAWLKQAKSASTRPFHFFRKLTSGLVPLRIESTNKGIACLRPRCRPLLPQSILWIAFRDRRYLTMKQLCGGCANVSQLLEHSWYDFWRKE